MHYQVATANEIICLFNIESTTQPEVWEKNRMGPFNRVLLIVACHHSAITQIMCVVTYSDDKLSHSRAKRMEQKNELYIIKITPLLDVYKQPHIKMYKCGFLKRVD